jgi:23S rRNA (adenine2503-C2)-methyltransferase
MGSSMPNILGLSHRQLTELFKHRYGKGAFHATAVYREVFRNGNPEFHRAEAFSKSGGLPAQLQKDLGVHLNSIEKTVEEDLIKFVTRLEDGLCIESVIIPMSSYYTVCISSQAGCKMGCLFCETGSNGFYRNLYTEEIVGQVYAARFHFGYDIRNVVIMGMGEPLDNFDSVAQAIRIISDQRGLNIAKRHITVSTVGIIEGIRKLAELNWRDLNLAVSLNAPNDTIRSRIMPINRTASMEKLRQALMAYPLNRKSTIFVEYVLIKGLNDSRENARQLVEFLNPLKCKVNLIPVNPNTYADADTRFDTPSMEDIDRFYDWLIEDGLFVRIRTARGLGLMAACGQLGGRNQVYIH